jgi:hypothetical protein
MHDVFRDLVLANSCEVIRSCKDEKEEKNRSDQKIYDRPSLVSQKPDSVMFVILFIVAL